MTENISNPQRQKETLDRILDDLRSSDVTNCLAASRELGMINFSSEAIVLQLEKLALQDNLSVREAALRALDLRTSQFVSTKLSSLTKPFRQIMLSEINVWQEDGLIEQHRAEVLRRHYDFDMRTGIASQGISAPEEKPAARILESQPAVTARPELQIEKQDERKVIREKESLSSSRQPAPSRSLMEVLLSETSIKIYLYLGAFFVIAAAAILAALVEAARLPVLLVATALFAGGAIGIKKRLPQPSFALASVFSFLLPIDANVLADSLTLSARGNNVYWTFVFLFMAAIWAFGTWFYTSRLFSVASFLSLVLGALRFGEIFNATTGWSIFSIAVANLIGILGVQLLKRWKDQTFAQPVFLLAQVMQVGLLAVSFIATIINQFDSSVTTGSWIASALTWILAASFYVASDLIIPFLFFPWMAVASLFLVPWLTLSTFDASASIQIAGFTFWGVIHALASEFVQRGNHPTMAKYHYPFLAWSLPLFFVAVIWGLTEEVWYGFAAFLFAGITYTIINVMRARWYVWLTALLAGLGAYFTFFGLPFMKDVEIYSGYQTLGASLILLIPELFFKEKFSFTRHWNWPPITLGMLLAGTNIIFILGDITSGLGFGSSAFGSAAIIMGVYAILFAAHGLRFQWHLLGYFATACAVLAAIYTLRYFDSDWWLPTLTALSVVYYAASFLPCGEGNKPWSAILTHSGLALGSIISLLAMILSEPFGGWYALVIAVLFIIEMYARKNSWLEIFAITMLSISLLQVLDQFKVHEEAYRFFGLGLLWPVSDMIFKFTLTGRKLESVTKIAAAMLAITSTFLLATDLAATNATICFAAYTLVAVAYIWVYKNSLLGYIPAIFFALTVHFAVKATGLTAWIFPQIVVALLYYVAGYFLRRADKAKGWDTMLLFSCLGLGSLVALAAPFQTGGLDKSIPIAITATFYAAEAFARKNVWLGFPANILYLIAYFVILNKLNVDEPQFFTVGAAALGLLQHYLLRRAGGKRAAFITGLVSQLVLLGASYIQMVDTGELKYFFLLFFQALVVLVYGIVVRSRSLIIAPIGFAVLAVITVLYNALKDLSLVFIIGIAGLILISLGILAVVMRERITTMAERFSDWDA